MQAATQTRIEPEDETLAEIPAGPRWPVAKRVAFRFAFSYFVAYIIPFPLDNLPFTDRLIQKYTNMWQAIVPWVGKHILHLSYDITVFQNGSGDTTYNYVQVLCMLVIAAAATVIWSVLDRRRVNYIRLHQFLRIYIRFSLAGAMIGYGAFKIIPIQMPAPYLTRLIEPYGDSSPMGILWTFIGASKGFEMFTGCAEMLGGVLLIFPRTTMLGALICLADTIQIFVLNMCYDVPVKLYSFHLLVMSVILLLPECRRLLNMFLFNRQVEPSNVFHFSKRRWLDRGVVVLQVLFGLFLIGSSLYGGYKQSKVYGDSAPKSPLYGIWMVDEFSVGGQVRPPLLTDAARWQRVIFQFPGAVTIQPMTGSNQGYRLELDMEKKTLQLGKRDDAEWKAEFTLKDSEPGQLTLEGEMDGNMTQAKMTRFDESKFLLRNRGFHWIQEFPFNR